MPCNFNLDEPLLEQQSVRELCGYSTEATEFKMTQDDLKTIAQMSIAEQLQNHNEGEQAMFSLELTFGEPQSDGEMATLMTSEPIAAAPDEGGTMFPELPVSEQFLSHLVRRLDQAAVDSSLVNQERTRLMVNFTSSSVLVGQRACCNGRFQYNPNGKGCLEGSQCINPEHIVADF
jgi:hypothetical protein